MIRPSDNPPLFVVVDRIEKKILIDAGISRTVIVLATASRKYLEGRRVGRIIVSQRLPFFPVRFTEIYRELYDIATLYGGLPIELVDIAVFTKEMEDEWNAQHGLGLDSRDTNRPSGHGRSL